MATHPTVFLPREPHKLYEKANDMIPEDEPPKSEGDQYDMLLGRAGG